MSHFENDQSRIDATVIGETITVTIAFGSGHQQSFTTSLDREHVDHIRASITRSCTTLIPLRETPDGVSGGCVMIAQKAFQDPPGLSGTIHIHPRRRAGTTSATRTRRNLTK
ncbi:MAG: hypothetical protein H8F28_25715 [Fibrella sp.]|nr:hypothetical protein [Armatimonadota bacterium]